MVLMDQYQQGVHAMGDLILVASIFAFGAGCGFYLRDWISKRRRKQYLKLKQAKRSRRQAISSHLEIRNRGL
jgi:hypothetical protein